MRRGALIGKGTYGNSNKNTGQRGEITGRKIQRVPSADGTRAGTHLARTKSRKNRIIRPVKEVRGL